MKITNMLTYDDNEKAYNKCKIFIPNDTTNVLKTSQALATDSIINK